MLPRGKSLKKHPVQCLHPTRLTLLPSLPPFESARLSSKRYESFTCGLSDNSWLNALLQTHQVCYPKILRSLSHTSAQDTWHTDQLAFNEDQLQSLSTMLVGTSYCKSFEHNLYLGRFLPDGQTHKLVSVICHSLIANYDYFPLLLLS